jgi:hypothetical protein
LERSRKIPEPLERINTGKRHEDKAAPDPDFIVEGAEPLRYAVSPHIAFKLRITNASPQPIHSIILRCQVQLDVTRRQYTAEDRQRLAELFGEPGQWPQTLRGMLWTNVSTIVRGFSEATTIDLQVPCTFDFNVAATKYFAGLGDGEIPLSFFFGGTIFYASDTAALQAGQISWEKEASYRMPVQTWRSMMDMYYPNTAWLCLSRDAFDRLNAFKVQHGIPTFEQALEKLTH